jgi:hypothetical protein
LQLWFGYWFKLDLGTKKIRAYVGAEIYGPAIYGESDCGFRLSDTVSLDEPEAQRLLLQAISDAITDAIRDARQRGTAIKTRGRLRKLKEAVGIALKGYKP